MLTFIAAPAILTNASSVMALGTSNRFARAIDRVRALSAELGSQQAMPEALKELRLKQLRFASRRVLLVIRALTAFYVSLGAFAAASLTSLVGAALVLAHLDVPRALVMAVAFTCGAVGVGGLVTGSVLLVWESRLALAILREETNFVVEGLHLGEQERGDGRHFYSGGPNSRSWGAPWWHFMHDSTRPAAVTCLPSAVTVP